MLGGETKIEKVWEYRNLTCVVAIMPMGHRCGYVGVPKRSKAYDEDRDILQNTIDVHGGITWDEKVNTYPINRPDLRWLGFDCAHSMDRPDPDLADERYKILAVSPLSRSGVIRTLPFCEEECRRMADQVINMYGEVSPSYTVELEEGLFEV